MVAAGLVIQIITSRFFLGLTGAYNSWMSVRDFICLMGQDVGEMFYVAGFWIIFDRAKTYRFLMVAEFWIILLFVDMATLLFLNPFELSPPKDAGFLVGAFILLLRIKKYFKHG